MGSNPRWILLALAFSTVLAAAPAVHATSVACDDGRTGLGTTSYQTCLLGSSDRSTWYGTMRTDTTVAVDVQVTPRGLPLLDVGAGARSTNDTQGNRTTNGTWVGGGAEAPLAGYLGMPAGVGASLQQRTATTSGDRATAVRTTSLSAGPITYTQETYEGACGQMLVVRYVGMVPFVSGRPCVAAIPMLPQAP